MLIKFRMLIQLVFTAVTNGYVIGFVEGKIYQGNFKFTCVPGLNCYSCPSALGSCPIGAVQAMLTGRKKSFPFYIVGIGLLFGILFGRFICGFLCPFGLVQDLLHKIKFSQFKLFNKRELPKKISKPLTYLKYLILIVFVIVMPIFVTDKFGLSDPFFCKWICPSGTLFGGVPLLTLNKGLRNNIGFLFGVKASILILIIVSSIIVYRPFCKYLCPLGAFYGLFNKFSFYQMNVDKTKCTNCKACEKACPMQVEVLKDINSPECIRCGECTKACKYSCISTGFLLKEKIETKDCYSIEVDL